MNTNKTPELKAVPPAQWLRYCEHHWLEGFDSDGHSHGLYCLQWAPGSKQWHRSGEIDTYVGGVGRTLAFISQWKYICHAPVHVKSVDTKRPPPVSQHEPRPPGPNEIKSANHYWLKDYQGFEYVFQWNPGAQKWGHSGHCGTDLFHSATGMLLIGKCPLPNC